jgi:hypothetical protein
LIYATVNKKMGNISVWIQREVHRKNRSTIQSYRFRIETNFRNNINFFSFFRLNFNEKIIIW